MMVDMGSQDPNRHGGSRIREHAMRSRRTLDLIVIRMSVVRSRREGSVFITHHRYDHRFLEWQLSIDHRPIIPSASLGRHAFLLSARSHGRDKRERQDDREIEKKDLISINKALQREKELLYSTVVCFPLSELRMSPQRKARP
jgi:hypothetical protein